MKKLFIILFLAAGTITIVSCSPGIVITERPGAPLYARPTAPGAHYVWVDGDWIIVNRQYQWREGYWSPPRRRAWASGHWAPHRNGWRWRRGHWR